MSTTQTIVLIAHTVIALLIIVLVLLQRGKGATAGAAFGAGASGTVFGARGSSNFFSRATAVMATLFFVSSLALAYLTSQSVGSVDSLLESAPPAETVAPDIDGSPAPETAPADELPALGTEEAAGEAEGELPALNSAEEDVPEEGAEQ